MQDPAEILFTAVPKLVENTPKMSRFGTKLRKKLASVGRREQSSSEKRGEKWFSIGIYFKKGPGPRDECRWRAENPHRQQRAAASESLNYQDSQCSSSTESTVKTSSPIPETPSTLLTRDQKFYNNYLKEQEVKSRNEREQRRLARRVARWCKGGPIPSLQDFTKMSSKQVSDYLRLKKVSEEWIEVVVSQIEYVREKDEIPPEVEVKGVPSTWPFTEDYTMAMCISRLRKDRMSYAQIGHVFYQLLYGHDNPIQNAVTKLKDRGYTFSDMGHAMVDLFGDTGSDGKGLVITESKPYIHPEDPEEEEPRRGRRDKGNKRERAGELSAQQQHQLQHEIDGDWFPFPETLEEERAEIENENSILPPPGLPVPKGYQMHSNGRAYRIFEAKFCVPLVDEPPASLPQTVRRRRRRRAKLAGAHSSESPPEGISELSFKSRCKPEADSKSESQPKRKASVEYMSPSELECEPTSKSGPESAAQPESKLKSSSESRNECSEKVEAPITQRGTRPRYLRLSLRNLAPNWLDTNPWAEGEGPNLLDRRGTTGKVISDIEARAHIWSFLEYQTQSSRCF